MKQRLLSIILALVLLLSLTPSAAYAAGDSMGSDPAVIVSNDYESIELETYGIPTVVGSGEESGSVYDVGSISDFVAQFKTCLMLHETPFTITIGLREELDGEPMSQEDAQACVDDFCNTLNAALDEAFAEHTGIPYEGDYLANRASWKLTTSIESETDSSTYIDFTFTSLFNVTYTTTLSEEEYVNTQVKAILNSGSLPLDGLSDFEKIKAIHDFICDNVEYDDEHYGDETYLHQYTAYAALHDRTCVCQGYSLLFYRLCLEAGIDVRYIGGYADDEPHAWNIVQLGDYYYYVDTTWDDGSEGKTYDYFLKGSNNSEFASRQVDEKYATEEFMKAYPIPEEDYAIPDVEPSYETCSLTLDGMIGVNFYISLPEGDDYNYEESEMVFTISNPDSSDSKVTTCYDVFNCEDTNETGDYYGFTCPISTIQMADNISAKFYYTYAGNEFSVARNYSVREYIRDYLDSDGDELTKNLVKKLADYGYHAQQYLSEIRGWTSDDYAMLSDMPSDLPYDHSNEEYYINEQLETASANVEYSDDIHEISFSLILDSATSLCAYFKPDEDYNGTVKIYYNQNGEQGDEIEAKKMKDGSYRICTPGIRADYLGTANYSVIAVTENGEATIDLSVYAYLKALYNSKIDDKKAVNLVASMLRYAEVAES